MYCGLSNYLLLLPCRKYFQEALVAYLNCQHHDSGALGYYHKISVTGTQHCNAGTLDRTTEMASIK